MLAIAGWTRLQSPRNVAQKSTNVGKAVRNEDGKREISGVASAHLEMALGETVTIDRLERHLWSAADILPGSIDSADYRKGSRSSGKRGDDIDFGGALATRLKVGVRLYLGLLAMGEVLFDYKVWAPSGRLCTSA